MTRHAERRARSRFGWTRDDIVRAAEDAMSSAVPFPKDGQRIVGHPVRLVVEMQSEIELLVITVLM